ncbi:MAG: hypothetical protein GF331_25675 [Chitinivibrionales bacterium]|nr:hypothetical protein [Chitinivibrionales bacterium]
MKLADLVGGERIDEGTIVSRSSRRAVVEIGPSCDEHEACPSCASHGGCTHARRPERVEVEGIGEDDGLQVGSRVRVRRFAVHEGFAAITVFGGPLIGALVALWVLVSGFGGNPESAGGVIAGLGGLAGGFVLAAMVNRALIRRLAEPLLVQSTRPKPSGRDYLRRKRAG